MNKEKLNILLANLEGIDAVLGESLAEVCRGDIALSSVMFPLHMAKLDIERAMDAVKFQLNNKESL